tara:strand:- start:2529 stop:4664 length:2136 start_codon:yes stop_codon:yes gene_type:complete
MSQRTPEEVAEIAKQIAAELTKLKALGDELGPEQQRQLAQYAVILNQIKAASQQQQQFLASQQRKIELMKQEGVIDQQKIQSIKREVLENQAKAEAYTANQAEIDAALQGTREKTEEFYRRQRQGMNEVNEDRLRLMQQQEQDTDNLVELGAKVAPGIATGFSEGISGLNAEMAFLAATFGEDFVRGLQQDMAAGLPAMDQQSAAIAKQTGLIGDWNTTMSAAADPVYFSRIADPEQVKIFQDLGGGLQDIGTNASDTGPVLTAILNNVNEFRPSFMDANEGLTAFTTNNIVGLEKLNVSANTSTGIIDKFNKGLGLTPEASVLSTRSLVSVADSLEISTNRAFDNFSTTFPQMSLYGDEAINVFSNLEAQSIATGISVERLGTIASGLDTFKGAAEAAAKFNAVMGDNLLSMTDLAMADADEKILMIQDAMERSGVTFETANKHQKMAIMNTLGLTNAEEAGRLLREGAADDYEVRAANIDTTAKSTADMQKQIQGTFTTTEQATRSFSQLEAGFSEWVNRTRKMAVEGSNIMSNSFNKIYTMLQDAEASAISTVAAYELLVGGTTDAAAALAEGNFSEAAGKALGLTAVGLAGQVAPTVAQAVGLEAIPKPAAGAPGTVETPGLMELAAERMRGATGGPAGDQLVRIAEALENGSLLQADITSNIILDGKTIQSIKESASVDAVNRTKAIMKARAEGRPTIGMETDFAN